MTRSSNAAPAESRSRRSLQVFGRRQFLGGFVFGLEIGVSEVWCLP